MHLGVLFVFSVSFVAKNQAVAVGTIVSAVIITSFFLFFCICFLRVWFSGSGSNCDCDCDCNPCECICDCLSGTCERLCGCFSSCCECLCDAREGCWDSSETCRQGFCAIVSCQVCHRDCCHDYRSRMATNAVCAACCCCFVIYGGNCMLFNRIEYLAI